MHRLLSLDNVGEDWYELSYNFVISEQAPVRYERGEAASTILPYPKNLASIADLLVQAMGNLGGQQGHTASRERGTVHRLIRTAESHWSCSKSRPDQEEARGLAADAMGKPMHDMGKSNAVPQYLRSEAIVTESASETANTPGVFSEDSIERQLCYLAPRYSSTEPPEPPKWQATAGIVRATSGVRFPGRLLLPIAAPMHIVTLGVNCMQAVLSSRPSWQVPRQDDEVSIYTNPDYNLDLSPVKTYFDGRDNWDCDFCGPECFCSSLDD